MKDTKANSKTLQSLIMKILQTPIFGKQIKKLHANQKKNLDIAITKIIDNPSLGNAKNGDLNYVRVHKFNMVKQLILLAYEWNQDENQLILFALGSHENCYRDLKK